MYFIYTLKVPKELEEEFNLLFSERFPQGWEWEEEEGFIFFRLYLKKEESKVLEVLLTKYEPLELKIEELKLEDWVVSWKKYFQPLVVGKKLLILPPWERNFFSQEKIKIFIEPAQAFGTGYHPTTQLMLENIESYFERISEKKFLEILDFGCGTGILGIACAKLYDNLKVYALDIDEIALEATFKNAKLNEVESKLVILKDLPLEKKFDLILANLSFKELKKEALNLLKVAEKKKTKLFLSGLLEEHVEEIRSIYLSLGFINKKIERKEEWFFLEFVYA